MLFFGWGRKSKTRELDQGRVLILTYAYFHLFWLFRISWPRGYSTATATEQGWATRPLDPAEVASLDPEGTLRLHWWWRWGLLITIGLIVVIAVLAQMM